MRKIYLAGGINGLSDADAKDWRARASEALRAAGFEILDPMSRDYRGKEVGNAIEIVENDLRDIEQCFGVLAMCERPSWGTAMEIRFMFDQRTPVHAVCSSASPSPWLVYHCAALYPTLDAAISGLVASLG